MRWENMTAEAKQKTLSRFHRALNRKLFAGELKEVLLYADFVDGTDGGIISAFMCGENGHNCIFMTGLYENMIERFATVKGQTLFCVVVLLHEMIHQYCYEHGIDGKEHADHGERFKEIAAAHGLVSCYDKSGVYYNRAAPVLAEAIKYYRFG